MPKTPPRPHEAAAEHDYGRDTCFLCGSPLTQECRSEEHVFPRWLQTRFALRDRTIRLLNGVRIAYRKLTVPCCVACNNGPLSRLERRVQKHLAVAVCDLDDAARQDLFLWTTKILYTLMYKSFFTARDPRNRDGTTIITSEMLRGFDLMHLILQGIRVGLIYHGETPLPGSFAVFEVLSPSDVLAQFDWRDDPSTGTIYVRLANRALLLSHDGGAQTIAVGKIIERYGQRALHPLQVEECAAKFFYKEIIAERFPVFSSSEHDGPLHIWLNSFDYPSARALTAVYIHKDEGPISSVTVPHPLDDGRPLFGEWRLEHYCQVLSSFTGLPEDMLLGPGGTHSTWLFDEKGDDLVFDLEKHPYPL